ERPHAPPSASDTARLSARPGRRPAPTRSRRARGPDESAHPRWPRARLRAQGNAPSCRTPRSILMLDDRSILVTGGTGSFGRALVKEILARHRPRRLVIFSRDEQKQFRMAQELAPETHPCLRYFIGDVRDKERLLRALDGIDLVVHAAAMKHVPIAEY